MSKLKAYKMVDEKYCTDCLCVIPSDVYLKSEADKVIAELEEERRWRKCSEENPPHSGIYLVCIAGHVRTLDTFDSDRNLWRNYNPTHWMPLPSAPKEENK